MVVEVERTVTVEAPVEAVWERLSDPEWRARAVGVVRSYRIEGQAVVWEVEVPLVGRTVSVRTRDVERDAPSYVRFTGESTVFDIDGEHELAAVEDGCRIESRFTVDGALPGVERYFRANIDDELEGMLDALERDLAD